MDEGRVSRMCKTALRRALKLKATDDIDMSLLEFIVCFSELVENEPEYAALSDADLEIFFEESLIAYLQKEDETVVELTDGQKKQLWHNFLVDQYRLGEINTPKLQAKYAEAMRWEAEGIVKPHVHDP